MFGIEPSANVSGPLRVWDWPQAGVQYVVGADVSEGHVKGDWSAAWVIKAHNMEHVATWHGKMDPYAFAHELFLLGRFYNHALLAPEKNNHGEGVVRELIHTHAYPNLYRRMMKQDVDSVDERKAKDYGWLTREPQRRQIQAMLNKVIGAQVPIRDHRFKVEALTWLLDDRGKPETADGACDDVLMAAGIAYCVCAEVYGVQFAVANAKRPRTEEQKHASERRKEWSGIMEQYGRGGVPRDHNPHEGVPSELIF